MEGLEARVLLRRHQGPEVVRGGEMGGGVRELRRPPAKAFALAWGKAASQWDGGLSFLKTGKIKRRKRRDCIS